MKKTKVVVLGGIFAFVALIAGMALSQYTQAEKKIDPSQFHGTLLQKPRGVEQFNLVGVDNQPFNNKSLQGKWTMVFFGFTNCGYLCPTTMSELAKMYHILEHEGVKPLPQVVMISIDPNRDSLDTLKNYVSTFDSHFYGARGDEDKVKKMTREMGIAYSKVILPNAKDNKNYDMQHSGAVMLFNPKGELRAFFTTPHQANLLAKDYQLLVG
ncbi:SCO1/SenC family protein [Legionella beliardensis]|uniref:SCO1/SenC family protein n=1 Tax=Legionella beliardensis TaxID=91822 RepID=A0A378HZE2_9GAMM|nr:SCO family protein [Legionella beliardensis]STX28122.1 SCO1/SenC family protein [Legionella beliardensis]